MRRHINSENLSFLFILCVTCFSTSLILDSLYNILSDKKLSLFNLLFQIWSEGLKSAATSQRLITVVLRLYFIVQCRYIDEHNKFRFYPKLT